MADSTVSDFSKLKVVELRKELKSRGLPTTGDKSELVDRLLSATSEDQEDHGDINLDSDEIDSDSVLEDEDDKSQTDILDDATVDTINEELALAEQPSKLTTEETKPSRTFKRKITSESSKAKNDDKSGDKEPTAKKIVLNRATSITTPAKPVEEEKTETKPVEAPIIDSNKVKITAEIDSKTRLELRAKRFGLPVKMSDNERKEARMKRFGQNAETGNSALPSGTLGENLDKLKQRSERFGLSVSKIMTDIENKEKLERRKAKFGTA